MFQDVVTSLARFGLKNTDAKIFMALLHFKDGLYVYEIVAQTKLKRSTVDLVLKRLVADGYVSRVKVGKRFRFFAEKPEAILFRKEQAVTDFRELLPFIAKLGADKGETEIRFFEGVEGIRKIYDDVLMKLSLAEGAGRELLSFSSGAHVMRIFPDMQKAFIKKRVAMGVTYRAIAPQTSGKVPEWTNEQKDLRIVKYVDEKRFPFKVTFEIYADSILIYSPIRPVGGVIISNPRIADSMRSLFRLVWELLAD